MPSAAGMAERTRGLRQPFATTTCNHTWTDDGTSFSKPHSDASEGVSVGSGLWWASAVRGLGLWLSEGVSVWCGALCRLANVRTSNVREQHTHTHTQYSR